ncbi:MAG: hypothetical protein F6K50_42440 [Moorea sp. SIO3I7]|nr:hypothetical protein [Moorena sp. SIO3I7]NEO08071.1 hypothetical protein [Moorena sp. SIO3I8]NEP26882.1 hypothetical protein [Moorena sp. SIO3I6]
MAWEYIESITMTFLYHQVSLAQLSTKARSDRTRWQSGTELPMVTYGEVSLGFIVPLEIITALPTEAVAGMPLKELQRWLFRNRQGWLEGIMDALTLTYKKQEVLGLLHPRYSDQLSKLIRTRRSA